MATHTGEAITTGVLTVFLALLAWACFHRGRRSQGWFYVTAAVLVAALTVIAAAGHVFHGW